ncbi:glycosyltransferase family 2 protein [Loigolactobacillus coryniformis]|uniref:glycosyltransferase family 2 protein n=1 Tax=Loigolactobacillus coryniformis TaxID=1610 RepID=UPI0009D6EFFE
MNPKVSIIVPVYNLENYITETLKTILNQSYTNLEIIIIDDCSSDDTFSVINQISDARLKFLDRRKTWGYLQRGI